MTALIGCLHFGSTDKSRWDVPVVMIGGLPVAVMDRARSAALMVDVARKRRDTAQAPLVFTSANGQVLSMCARHSQTRELFLGADLIHADGMSLVFVSRLFHKTPLPQRVATTDLFHDVARLAQESGTRMFLLGAAYSVVNQAVQRGAHPLPRSQYCREQRRLSATARRRRTDHRRHQRRPPRYSLARSRRAGRAVLRHTSSRPAARRGLDQDVGRPVRLSFRKKFPCARLDAGRRA